MYLYLSPFLQAPLDVTDAEQILENAEAELAAARAELESLEAQKVICVDMTAAYLYLARCRKRGGHLTQV
jgi:hypothetical protein